MENRYDVVIIGSGLGGLECGVMLSKEGYNVCVLEQSAIYGGCLQSFSRNGKIIDTGIHYIGSMDEGQIMRQYLKYFGIFDKLSIIKLDDDFDVMTLGNDGVYSYKQGYDAFTTSLSEQFPSQKSGIIKYCDKIRDIGSSISVNVHRKGEFSSGGINHLGLNASDFINECVSDSLLRNILAGTNVLYGGIKEASNLYHHAMINHSNIEGAYRFVGGTQKVADLLVQQIRNNGGTVINKSKVTSIYAEDTEVKYVLLKNGEIISGKYFISNIHPSTTFNMLNSTSVVKKAYKTRLSLLPNTYGLFSVYLLMKKNSFPYMNKNYYYYHSNDAWSTIIDTPSYLPKSILLSTQLAEKNSIYSDVVTLMSPISKSVFEKWNSTTLTNRGSEYNDFKEEITNSIIEFAIDYCPNIKNSIEHIYSASPLTYEHYTGTPQGSAYGILKDYRNTMSSLLPTRTKLSNLYLTGQNLNVHGALGVTLTAANTCAELLGKEYLARKIGRI